MNKLYFLASISILAIMSCSPVKMAVSDSLQENQHVYPVKGRQGFLIKQRMSFGEFSTSEVKRSWTKGGSGRFAIGSGNGTQGDWDNLISYEYMKKKQTIRFDLSDGKEQSSAYCVSKFNFKDVEIGKTSSIINIGMDLLGIGGRSSSNYYVQIYMKGSDRPWEMMINNQAVEARAKNYTGILGLSKDRYYTIVPVNKVEKNGKDVSTWASNLGFEFRNERDKAVAAVSLIDGGMVYLGKTNPEERLLLANACTALLLQEIPEKEN